MNFLIVSVYIWIFIDDFVTRSISLWGVIVLAIFCLLNVLTWKNLTITEISISYLLVFLIVGSLITYLTFTKGFSSITHNIGLGDFAVIFIFPISMSSQWMIFILIAGAILSIFGILLLPSFKKKGAPLAGIYGILSAVYIFFHDLI